MSLYCGFGMICWNFHLGRWGWGWVGWVSPTGPGAGVHLPGQTPLGKTPNPAEPLQPSGWWDTPLPHVDRITDRCKNITIPQFNLRTVIKSSLRMSHQSDCSLLDTYSLLQTARLGDWRPLKLNSYWRNWGKRGINNPLLRKTKTWF